MDGFETITVFDALDLKVSSAFWLEGIIELLVRVVGCTVGEKGRIRIQTCIFWTFVCKILVKMCSTVIAFIQ